MFEIRGSHDNRNHYADSAATTGSNHFTGLHVLAELYGVTHVRLNDPITLRNALRTALTRAGATIRELHAHQFSPQGVTVLAMLSESHASIHTYPEAGAAFVDVFTCGDTANPELAVRELATELAASSVATQTVPRGHPTTAPQQQSSE